GARRAARAPPPVGAQLQRRDHRSGAARAVGAAAAGTARSRACPGPRPAHRARVRPGSPPHLCPNLTDARAAVDPRASPARAGGLPADLLGAMGLHEIEQKSDRQTRANGQAAQLGRRVGGRRPFGYAADGVTVREDEGEAIRRGYEAVLTGMSLGSVARDWN